MLQVTHTLHAPTPHTLTPSHLTLVASPLSPHWTSNGLCHHTTPHLTSHHTTIMRCVTITVLLVCNHSSTTGLHHSCVTIAVLLGPPMSTWLLSSYALFIYLDLIHYCGIDYLFIYICCYPCTLAAIHLGVGWHEAASGHTSPHLIRTWPHPPYYCYDVPRATAHAIRRALALT